MIGLAGAGGGTGGGTGGGAGGGVGLYAGAGCSIMSGAGRTSSRGRLRLRHHNHIPLNSAAIPPSTTNGAHSGHEVRGGERGGGICPASGPASGASSVLGPAPPATALSSGTGNEPRSGPAGDAVRGAGRRAVPGPRCGWRGWGSSADDGTGAVVWGGGEVCGRGTGKGKGVVRGPSGGGGMMPSGGPAARPDDGPAGAGNPGVALAIAAPPSASITMPVVAKRVCVRNSKDISGTSGNVPA